MKIEHAERFSRRIEDYLAALQAGEVNAICAHFAPQARVFSPFLGWMDVRPFFEAVARASGTSVLTLLDICVSTRGRRSATGRFTYDWGLKDGSRVCFDCVDVFDFDADGQIEQLLIVYDTHPIRRDVGDKYA